jgi:PAS domain S-box-containing protein
MIDQSASAPSELPAQPRSADLIANLAIGIVLAIGIFVITGWIFDLAPLKCIYPNWTPVRIVAGICMVLSALSLVCARTGTERRGYRFAAIALAVAVGIMGIVTFSAYLDEVARGHGASIASSPLLELVLGPSSRMAAIAALSFVVVSAALTLLAMGSRTTSGIAHGLALPTAAVSYLMVVGHAFDVSALYRWMNSTVSLPTAIALFLLCLAVFCSRTDTWLTEVLISRESGGMIVRRLLLPFLILPTVIGWFRYQGELAGYFPSSVGVALVAIFYTFIFLGFIWFTARSINKADSRRRAGENALSESEKRYRSLVDMSPVAVFVNRHNRVEYVNSAGVRLFGAETREQLLGKPLAELFHPEYHAVMHERIQRLLQGQQVPVVEDRIIRLNGEIREVSIAAAYFDDRSGRAIQVILQDITIRKNVEEALRRQAALIDLSPNAVFVRLPDGTITYWSKGAETMYGWTKDEALGRRTHELLRTEFPQALGKIEYQIRHSGQWSGELVHQTKDGRKVVLQSAWLAQKDAQGEIKEVLEANVDVTARKEEEEKLRQLNRKLTVHSRSDQALARAGDEASYLADICRIIVEDCGHTMVWVGYAEADEGKSIRPVAYSGFEKGYLDTLNLTWADTVRGRGPTGRAIRTGKICACPDMTIDPLFEPWREEARQRGYASSISFPLLSGSKAFGALTIYSRDRGPFPAEEERLLGDLARDLAHGIDLLRLRAAHARAEQALRESEQRLRSILDVLPVAIFLSDPAGNIIFTNPAVERIWGLRTHVSRDRYSEYKGVWFENGRPVEPEQWALSRTLETHQPFENELVEIVGSREDSKIVRNFSIPIRDASGNFLGAVVVTEDVTQRIRTQEELRIAKEAAEKSAGELARSNKDLEQFAYVSSHDLQEPLRMVTGFMQLLQKNYGGKLDSTADKYIQFAVDGAKRMEQLINDLLTYSRVGTTGRDPSPVDMDRMLDQALANLSLSIQESNTQIVRQPLPTIKADGPQMVQLFQNLIGNAIKFRGERAPVIRVDARKEDSFWIFSVSDNGIGIDPEFHNRVFLIFQRLHTADKFPGTGIGLALCRKITDRHNGEIWIESTPGQGSKFCFSLPV